MFISWITADPHIGYPCILACEAALKQVTSSIKQMCFILPSVLDKMQRGKDTHSFLSYYLLSLTARAAFFAYVSFVPHWNNNNQYNSNKVTQDSIQQSEGKYLICILFDMQHFSKDFFAINTSKRYLQRFFCYKNIQRYFAREQNIHMQKHGIINQYYSEQEVKHLPPGVVMQCPRS